MRPSDSIITGEGECLRPDRATKARMVLMKRLMMMAVLGLCAAGMLSGCNTVAGAGKDMQKAGSKVETTAEKCSDGKC